MTFSTRSRGDIYDNFHWPTDQLYRVNSCRIFCVHPHHPTPTPSILHPSLPYSVPGNQAFADRSSLQLLLVGFYQWKPLVVLPLDPGNSGESQTQGPDTLQSNTGHRNKPKKKKINRHMGTSVSLERALPSVQTMLKVQENLMAEPLD